MIQLHQKIDPLLPAPTTKTSIGEPARGWIDATGISLSPEDTVLLALLAYSLFLDQLLASWRSGAFVIIVKDCDVIQVTIIASEIHILLTPVRAVMLRIVGTASETQ
jgi:hypothetical protein